MHIRLTETKVRALKEPGIYRDDMVRGLFVEVSPTSARYKVQSTTKDRRTLRKTLGRCTDYTLEQARRWAQDVLGANRRGEVQRDVDRNVPTLGQAFDTYVALREHRGKDEKHTDNYRGNFRRYLSDWAKLPVDQITADMVERRHAQYAHAPTGIDKAFENLRAVLNHKGTRRHLPAGNPVEELEFYKTPSKGGNPMLSPEEVAAWWAAVDERVPNPTRRAFHRLMLLSGMRSKHLKAARLDWIDGPSIRFPKLKAGRPFRLPLSTPMVEIVKQQVELASSLSSPWLFPAESECGHLVEQREDVLPAWGHNLRRTYCTLAATTPIPQHFREFLVDHTVKGIHGTYVDTDPMFPALLETQEQISRVILGAVRVNHLHESTNEDGLRVPLEPV